MSEQKKTNKMNGKSQTGITNVRISNTTKKIIETYRAKINDKSYGKKVASDEIIAFALDFLKEEHITELQKRSMTSDDQEQFIFQQLKKENPDTSWSEYKTLLLKGELTKFIKKLDISL